MKLGEKSVDLPEQGDRDAVHVAAVVVRAGFSSGKRKVEPKPGSYVMFTDEDLRQVEPCEPHEAHGIVDPFADSLDEKFLILLRPDITSDVSHSFKVSLDKRPDGQSVWCHDSCGHGLSDEGFIH